MSFTVDQLLGEDGYRRMQAERDQREARATALWLSAQCPAAMSHLDTVDAQRFAHAGLRAARQAGMSSAADRQRYCLVQVYWGAGFEHDPQYRAGLDAAGWNRPGSRSIRAVLLQVDLHLACISADLADLRPAFRTVETAYRHRPEEPVLPGDALMLMQTGFPGRWSAMGEADRLDLARMMHRKAEAIGMTGADELAYLALALHFGADMARDARLPWAQAILGPEQGGFDTRQARRMALADAVLDHWRAQEAFR